MLAALRSMMTSKRYGSCSGPYAKKHTQKKEVPIPNWVAHETTHQQRARPEIAAIIGIICISMMMVSSRV